MRRIYAIWIIALAVAILFGWVTPSNAQVEDALYFPATGHTLDNSAGFLAFWQAHNGAKLIGMPISEPIPTDTGAIQYFEHTRLEQYVGDPATISVGPVAAEYSAALYRTFPAAPPQPEQAEVQLFANTGHTLRGPFLAFWQANNGEALIGPPISEPLWEKTSAGQRQVQYFTNMRLERDGSLAGTPNEIQVSNFGSALAALRGINTASVDNPGYHSAGPEAPSAPAIAPMSALPTPVPPAPTTIPQPAKPAKPQATGGTKHILVNLSDQWMYAYEGDTVVFDAPVATGRDGMETPTGNYAIYAKLKLQTMTGVLNGKPWVVPNVPNVMYINGGVALHGTYWHNLFGSGARPSHGCVNLPLKAAAWLYDWAPVGTPVRVTY